MCAGIKTGSKSERRPHVHFTRCTTTVTLLVMSISIAFRVAGRRFTRTPLVRGVAPSKQLDDLHLPSNDVMRAGSNDVLLCPRGFGNRAHAICLVNRTGFGMGGGSNRPFVIESNAVSIATLNARFGITTCPRRGRVVTALVRKGVGIRYSGKGRDCVIAPKRRIACHGDAKRDQLTRTGVRSMAT